MISSNPSLPPLIVISGIAALDQNSANQAGSQKSGEQSLKKGEQQLRPGLEIAVKIVANDGGGRYTLDVDSQRIEVQSRLPLQVGQQLNMLVREGENGLELAFKGLDIGQFLIRAMATGGSSQALGMIFGKGLAAQARSGAAASQAGGESFPLQSSRGMAESQALGGTATQTGKATVFLQGGSGVTVTQAGDDAVLSQRGSVRLPAPAIAIKMVELQQQFMQKSVSSQPVAAARIPAQFSTAVQQFTTELGRQITPLLGEGKVAEAMEHVTSALHSLARFFPPRAEGALPPGLTPSQRQLFQAFSALQQPESGGTTGGQGREAALGRVVQQLQNQLTSAPATAQGMVQPQQSPQAMLAALNSSLQGLQELVQLPAAFQHQPVSAPVFRSGIDGLFAFHLGFGRVGEGGASSGFSIIPPMSATGGEVRSGAILQQLVDGLGLDMEKLLAKGDLRGAAQGLKFQLLRQMKEGGEQIEREMQASGAKGSKSVEESGLLRQVGESHQALQSINFLQILQANLDKQGLLALPLPLSFLEQGFLLMEKDKEEREGGERQSEGTRFSVLMKLSSLGNVRVDLFQTKESVFLRFHTSSSEVTKLFQESQQELRAGLSPLQLQGVSYSSDPPGDPVSVLLQKCEGRRSSSLFEASV